MQITKAEVNPLEIKLRQPVRMAGISAIDKINSLFVRIDTLDGRSAWGCAVAHPHLTGESPEHALEFCESCAAQVIDLHPTNLEYSLGELSHFTSNSPAAACAFDLVFHDLLGLAANLPVYKLLGGYRNKIQTSATINLSDVTGSVELARLRAAAGFRMLKIKGGLDNDVQRVKAIQRALPDHILRLDADGGYDIQSALDVSRALENCLEMLEQPTSPDDLEGLRRITKYSSLPILVDQSVTGPDSALQIAAGKMADGISVKMVSCGGFRCANQINSIAQAAGISTMVSCIIEPFRIE